MPESGSRRRAFDQLAEHCRAREVAQDIAYQDGEFDQIVYLQQIISFISDAEGRQKAVAEAYRVLKADGIALFSFCASNRDCSLLARPMIGYSRAFELWHADDSPLNRCHGLWLGGRFNLSAILDVRPMSYWFRCEDAVQLLAEQRFTIVGIGTGPQDGANRGFVDRLKNSGNAHGWMFIRCVSKMKRNSSMQTRVSQARKTIYLTSQGHRRFS